MQLTQIICKDSCDTWQFNVELKDKLKEGWEVCDPGPVIIPAHGNFDHRLFVVIIKRED